eukprot:scaffold2830_cov131-Cylindrotheca_fusiformis.AAC.83
MTSISRRIPLLTAQRISPLYRMTKSSFQSIGSSPRPGILLVDTDVGFDDILAISCLVNTHTAEIPLVTTVGGIQSCPKRGARLVRSLVPSDTAVIAGRSQSKREPPRDWVVQARKELEQLQIQIDQQRYKDKSLLQQSGDYDLETTTSQQLSDCLLRYPDRSVDILCLGPLSNVASWMESDDTVRLLDAKLRQMWIMGGNLPSSSSIPEFNFAQDPTAAETTVLRLLESNLLDRIYIVPAQACEINEEVSQHEWKKIVDLAKSQDGILSKLFQIHSSLDSLKYDALCAFAYARPDAVSIIQKIHVGSIDTSSGLLIPASAVDNDSSTRMINFVVGFQLGDKPEFWEWIREAIRNESPFPKK